MSSAGKKGRRKRGKKRGVQSHRHVGLGDIFLWILKGVGYLLLAVVVLTMWLHASRPLVGDMGLGMYFKRKYKPQLEELSATLSPGEKRAGKFLHFSSVAAFVLVMIGAFLAGKSLCSDAASPLGVREIALGVFHAVVRLSAVGFCVLVALKLVVARVLKSSYSRLLSAMFFYSPEPPWCRYVSHAYGVACCLYAGGFLVYEHVVS